MNDFDDMILSRFLEPIFIYDAIDLHPYFNNYDRILRIKILGGGCTIHYINRGAQYFHIKDFIYITKTYT